MRRPEILAPAGDLERLKIALLYGADAIYLGGKDFSLRQGAGNFSKEDLEEGISFAHKRGARVYLTLNIFPHNRDLQRIPFFLEECQELHLDAIILSDPGLISLVQEYLPYVEIHLSTQANTVNWRSALFWQRQGVKRIILARELSHKEIGEINEKTEIGLEVFVHGSLCLSYSGRCYLSSYLTNRDANLGDCAHSCRWKYYLMEEKRPLEYFPIYGDDRGTYILNSRDLCLIQSMPTLMDLGLDAFKIEGRMKGLLYVATVTKMYREARDAYLRDPMSYEFQEEWLNELKKVSHREYTTGFFSGSYTLREKPPPTSSYIQQYRFLGCVREYLPSSSTIEVEVRNRICLGDRVEVFGPSTDPFSFTVEEMRDEAMERIKEAPHPHQTVYLPVPQRVERFSLLRRREE